MRVYALHELGKILHDAGLPRRRGERPHRDAGRLLRLRLAAHHHPRREALTSRRAASRRPTPGARRPTCAARQPSRSKIIPRSAAATSGASARTTIVVAKSARAVARSARADSRSTVEPRTIPRDRHRAGVPEGLRGRRARADEHVDLAADGTEARRRRRVGDGRTVTEAHHAVGVHLRRGEGSEPGGRTPRAPRAAASRRARGPSRARQR